MPVEISALPQPITQPGALYQLDPCMDPRWERFLEAHEGASIFHTPGWLEALRRTYGYEPVVFTTSSPDAKITAGQPFCRVNSWLTGKRLVSLPFSDHAALLTEAPDDFRTLLGELKRLVDDRTHRYIELRPVAEVGDSGLLHSGDRYYWHRLRLDNAAGDIFRSLHKDCVQRKIRRAEREKLSYTEGRSEVLIRQFYRLMVLTHHRHRRPPQPIAWFQNLADCLGERMKIRIASKDGRPVAGILTLCYKRTMVYKYASSDARFHHLGGMADLLWRVIQEAKESGCCELDMGRTDCDNPGLIRFKEHWGAERHILNYWSYSLAPLANSARWRLRVADKVFGWLPMAALPAAGRLLYRHVG